VVFQAALVSRLPAPLTLSLFSGQRIENGAAIHDHEMAHAADAAMDAITSFLISINQQLSRLPWLQSVVGVPFSLAFAAQRAQQGGRHEVVLVGEEKG